MSSILDALRKLEAAAPPALHAQPAPAARPMAVRRTLGALAVAFTAGVGLTVWMGREQPAPVVAHATRATPARLAAPEPLPVGMPRLAEAPVAVLMAEPPIPEPPAPKAPRPAPPAATVPAAVLPVATPAAARPPASASRAAAALPRGGPPASASRAAAAPPAAEPPASASRAAAAPPAAEPSASRLAAVSPAAPVPAPPAAATRPHAPAPPAEVARATPRASPAAPRARKIPVLPRPPSDAPRVHLSLLVYSSKPSRRTVTLSIDGGGLVTLREGETAGGISVARIFSDRAYLEHAGRVFLALPRD